MQARACCEYKSQIIIPYVQALTSQFQRKKIPAHSNGIPPSLKGTRSMGLLLALQRSSGFLLTPASPFLGPLSLSPPAPSILPSPLPDPLPRGIPLQNCPHSSSVFKHLKRTDKPNRIPVSCHFPKWPRRSCQPRDSSRTLSCSVELRRPLLQ